MSKTSQAVANHNRVPPDYYESSIRTNPGQRFWHHARFAQALKLVELDREATVLDIGSADGTFSEVLFDRIKPKRLVGIDVLRTSVDYANRRFRKNKKMSFRVADAHKLPFPAKTFSAVLCLEVLEHVFEPDRVIGEIKRVLTPGGYCLALVPAENFLFKIIWWFWIKMKGRIWNEAHVHHFSHHSLKEVFVDNGFTVDYESTFLLGMLYIIKARKP
jgi:ubiquinone/menaquinone biosynthesis C-methylase UbiE